ncbi:sodium:solute symporter family protein [Gaoshiqia sediminis]|uniref:Sodium:solute symporter family protein n=1 Tax=Gaoshiqia sediminis TaxID=2986998 RepID=A0AA42C9F2_9BACT|nr:sodium:solute symporter family protein [Gaoshiqia sediminis]MCW0482060.1 sodium:solute symporter family protein [Gaoshiqia sediminis]
MKIAILATYGLVLLLIGVYSAFRIKSPVDYFVAGKRNGILQISGSLLASILGGSAILGTANLAMTQSWAAAWYLLAASAGLWLLLPLVKKVNQLGKFTLTDMIGRFYGETARKSASVIIPLAWTGIVAAQVIAASKILVSIFGLSYENGVWLSGAVFIAYTLIGGQVSILKTDFLQAIIILLGILFSGIFLYFEHGTHTTPIASSFPFNVQFSPVDLFILFLTFSSTFVVGPDIYSRVFCARDENTARKSILIVASILIPFAFLPTYLGVFATENLPYEQLHSSVALMELIDFYLPEWVVGLMAAALLSAVLSSADTTLLTASMMLSELFNPDIDNRKSLNETRLFIVLVGLASMVIALKVTSIIGTLLLALAFYSGAFIVPLIAALADIKINKKLSIPAMIIGGTIALTGKILVSNLGMSWGNWVIVSAFAINFIILKIPFVFNPVNKEEEPAK